MESWNTKYEFSKDEKITFLKNNGWLPMYSLDNWIREGITISSIGGIPMEDAFDLCIGDIELEVKMQTPLNIIDWNKMSMDEYVHHLTQKFQFDSSGTAKAVFKLIDFYEQNKTKKS